MTPERLAAILAAYGANPSRWPDAEREDALQFMANDAVAGQAHEEDALDALLGTYQVPVISAAVRSRALAGVPVRVDLSILRRWWVGLVVSGAGLAGIATGVVALMVLAPRLDESGAMNVLDEQATIFTSFDVEGDSL